MTKNTLLEALKDFTRVATQNIVLPTAKQKDAAETFRPADVYLMRLPDGSSAKKKVPYIIHQFVNGKDKQPSGKLPESSALVRSIFCVYSADEQEGSLALLNLMDRLQIALEKQVVIGGQFELDMGVGVETLVYTDNTAPYYVGEMATTWKMPAIQREVTIL